MLVSDSGDRYRHFFIAATVGRIVSQGLAAIDLFEAGQIGNSAVLSRAAGETVGLLLYATDRLSTFDARGDQAAASLLMKRLLAATRVADDPTFKPVHVMDAVRTTQRYVPEFGLLYDVLSEWAHPNALGLHIYAPEPTLPTERELEALRLTTRSVAGTVLPLYLRVMAAQAWAGAVLPMLETVPESVLALLHQESKDTDSPAAVQERAAIRFAIEAFSQEMTLAGAARRTQDDGAFQYHLDKAMAALAPYLHDWNSGGRPR